MRRAMNLVIRVEEGPANHAAWVVVAKPITAVVAYAVAEVLRERDVMVVGRGCYIQVSALVATMLSIDQVGDDTGEHDLAEPFVTGTDRVVGTLRASSWGGL